MVPTSPSRTVAELRPRLPLLVSWETGALCAIVLVAFAVRIVSAANDLWLDEIWSVRFAHSVASPLELLTKIHHDNNHVLNSWYLYFIGDRSSWIAYRLLSITTGTATVAAIWASSRRYGGGAPLIAALLSAVSYPLILLSSEARGYAPATLCGVLAFALLGDAMREGRYRRVVLFWIVVTLGFLSHLSFLHVYLALFVWSAVRLYWDGGWTAVARGQANYHAVPVVALAALYFVSLRHMEIGGGPVYPFWQTARDTLATMTGAPDSDPARTLAILTGTGVIVWGLMRVWREDAAEGIFFLFVLLVAPVTVVLLTQRDILHFRYFVVCFPFAMLLLARPLAWAFTQGRGAKIAVALAMLLFGAGQLSRLVPLLRYGRGQYCEAVRFMATAESGSMIEVGSDHDFRNPLVLQFYARCLPAGKMMRYVPSGKWPSGGPEWLLLHSLEFGARPQTALAVRGGLHYTLARAFPFGGGSGWNWFVYRRVGSP